MFSSPCIGEEYYKIDALYKMFIPYGKIGKSFGLKVRRFRLSSSANIKDSYNFKKFGPAEWHVG